MVENLQARAIEAAEKYLAHKGYEVIETSRRAAPTLSPATRKRWCSWTWRRARAHALGMPDENLPAARERMEPWEARRWPSDTIGMMVLSKNKALLSHHINCLSADFSG